MCWKYSLHSNDNDNMLHLGRHNLHALLDALMQGYTTPPQCPHVFSAHNLSRPNAMMQSGLEIPS